MLRSVDSKGGFNTLWDQLDVPSLVDELQAQAVAVNRGELAHVEAMQNGSETLDTRATSATGGKNQAMATLDA